LLMGLYKQRPLKHWYGNIDNAPPLVWIGHPWESGGREFAHRFRAVTEWLEKGKCFGTHISVCTFRRWIRKGDCVLWIMDIASRTSEWVHTSEYFVAESDILSREDFGNVVLWIQKHAILRAIVDTGGKSIHCWFNLPLQPSGLFKLPPGLPPQQHSS